MTSAPGRSVGGPAEQVRAGERGDERVRRMRDELLRRRDLTQRAVDEDADLVGERNGVLVVVRDEQRRQAELAQELLELAAYRDLGVRVERRERLVEQQHAGIAGERPGERDSLALATRELGRPRLREMRDAESLEQLVGPRLPGVGDVLADVHVGEERVLLEDETDSALVGLAKQPLRRVEPDVRVQGDPPGGRLDQAGDRSEHRRLAGSGRPDERDGAFDLEGQLQDERPQRQLEVRRECRHEFSPAPARRSRSPAAASAPRARCPSARAGSRG